MTEQTSLIEFPCDFPIKIIGTNSPAFIQDVLAIAKKLFSDFDPANIQQSPSKKGNYIGLTVNVHALNQEMLDNFYKAIKAHPEVKMVL